MAASSPVGENAKSDIFPVTLYIERLLKNCNNKEAEFEVIFGRHFQSLSHLSLTWSSIKNF